MWLWSGSLSKSFHGPSSPHLQVQRTTMSKSFIPPCRAPTVVPSKRSSSSHLVLFLIVPP